MIRFPTTPEAFIADQEKMTGRKFAASQREVIGEYVELFNLEFDAGMKGLESSNVIKDTAEFYARNGKLQELKTPWLRHFYACVQHWCDEAYRQGKEAARYGCGERGTYP